LEKQASKEWVLWNRELQQLGETIKQGMGIVE
jgi:hypothetical protein